MTFKTQNGFTLVELAIALMVIGLLIGGVLKGQELIENARVTAFVREIKSYDTAAMIFRNTYGALPGDIKRPNRIPNCTEEICNVGGNGNGRLHWDDTNPGGRETHNFFPHMVKAGMLKGPEGNSTQVGVFDARDQFFPNSPLDYLITINHLDNVGFALASKHNGNYYSLYWEGDTTGAPSTKSLMAIDEKIDDGNPFQGYVGVNEVGTCPTTGDYSDYSTMEYDLTFTGNSECELVIHAEF